MQTVLQLRFLEKNERKILEEIVRNVTEIHRKKGRNTLNDKRAPQHSHLTLDYQFLLLGFSIDNGSTLTICQRKELKNSLLIRFYCCILYRDSCASLTLNNILFNIKSFFFSLILSLLLKIVEYDDRSCKDCLVAS